MNDLIISSHQIYFFPYIGFWRKMYQSDIMDLTCLYDDFNKEVYNHRVKIGNDTDNRYLTLPVGNKNLHRPCRDIKLKNDLLPQLYNIAEGWYRDSKNWDKYKDYLYNLFCNYTYEYYWELNAKVLLWLRDLLDIKTVLSIAPYEDLSSSEKIANRVKNYYNSTQYLSGIAGIDYLDLKVMKNKYNVDVSYINNPKNVDNYNTVSILSLLMNYDLEVVKEVIKGKSLQESIL